MRSYAREPPPRLQRNCRGSKMAHPTSVSQACNVGAGKLKARRGDAQSLESAPWAAIAKPLRMRTSPLALLQASSWTRYQPALGIGLSLSSRGSSILMDPRSRGSQSCLASSVKRVDCAMPRDRFKGSIRCARPDSRQLQRKPRLSPAKNVPAAFHVPDGTVFLVPPARLTGPRAGPRKPAAAFAH